MIRTIRLGTTWRTLRICKERFRGNTELISSGASWEVRDLYGFHLRGASEPGKPAVLYHATVHAREWIITMVSWENEP